ncbi:MFS transporter [Cupriavidus sp. TA19]|nr:MULTISPECIES: MFS transporter [unclassified Cupriavidus]
MLVLLAVVNWMDKAVLGMVAVPLMAELKLSPTEYGTLAGAIYFLFSFSAATVGFLANHRSAKWILFWMAALWSICQFSIWLAPSFAVILISRILLGLGEGPASGLSYHAVGKWFQDGERNLPIALQSIGAFAGIAVAAPGLTWVVSHYSWHAAFLTVGLVGLIWMFVWTFVGKEGPYSGGSTSTQNPSFAETDLKVPYRKLFLNPTFIGATSVGFVAYWALTIVSAWLPAYLRKGQGYSADHTASIMLGVSLTAIFFLATQAMTAQALMARGVSTRIARGVMASASVVIAGGLIVASTMIAPGGVQTATICLGFGLVLVTFTTGAAIISEFSPVRQRGALLGIYVGTLSLSGVICPSVFGFIVQQNGSGIDGYHTAILISGILIAFGGIIGLLLINPQREVNAVARLIQLQRKTEALVD